MSSKANSKNEADVHDYAEQVVKNLLKSKPNVRPWVGGSTNLIWAVSTFMLSTFWVFLVS